MHTQLHAGAPSAALPDVSWHSCDTAEALTHLESALDGLSHSEASERLTRFGANRLPETKPRSALSRLLMQFHNVLIYVLLGAAVVTLILGHQIDAGVILAVVLINAVIGFVQEASNADLATELTSLIETQRAYSSNATVIRTVDEMLQETTNIKR